MYALDSCTRLLPRPIVRWLRDAYLTTLDWWDRLRGRRDDLTPPRSLHFIGGGDFQGIGQTFVRHFVDVCRLRSDESVLDIGCGTGRMAVPLLSLLDKEGRYLGFDIAEKAITWCQNKITARNARFTFVFADIENDEYNPSGTIAADTYQFPCPDESIDFAFATSVFTHMRPPEVEHYLKELYRSLKTGGRAMLSFFIMDQTNHRLVSEGRASMAFKTLGDIYTIDPQTPERAIAYSEESIHQLLSRAGLCLAEPIRFGGWSGRESMLDGQDVIIVSKPG